MILPQVTEGNRSATGVSRAGPAHPADALGEAGQQTSFQGAAVAVESRTSPQASLEPVKVRSQRVFRPWDYVIYTLLTLLNLTSIACCSAIWLSGEGSRQAPLAYLGLTLLLCSAVAMQQARWWLLPIMRRPVPIEIRRPWRVGVATTFVPGAEPLEMLAATVEALVGLDFPHDTWVLDEDRNEEVRELCEKHGVGYFSRKDHPLYQAQAGPFQACTKYGNYNSWLTEVGYEKYDIVAAFDPDHLPDQSFLPTVLGYFEDPQVGYVQAAQAYGNQDESWVARGAAEETYDFYSTIQMASHGMRLPIIIGCHNTHRVAALRQIGGFAAHDADDILTTLVYRDAGWQGVYVPQILARGRTPPDFHSYVIQQRRWARSVADIKLRTYPSLSARTPATTRFFGVIHGVNYLVQGLLPILVLAVLCVICATAASSQDVTSRFVVSLFVLSASLGLSEFYRQKFYLDPRGEWGLHWRASVLRWARWPQMLLALFDVLLDRHPSYEITPKVSGLARGYRFLWPHLLAAVVLVLCWLIGVLRGEATTLSHGIAAGVIGATIALFLAARSTPRGCEKIEPGGLPN